MTTQEPRTEISTIGIHPYTDAIYLHSILDGLRARGLLDKATVKPRGDHHVITIEGVSEDRLTNELSEWIITMLAESLLPVPALADRISNCFRDGYGRRVLYENVRYYLVSNSSIDLKMIINLRKYYKNSKNEKKSEYDNKLVEYLKRMCVAPQIQRSILILPHIGKFKFKVDELIPTQAKGGGEDLRIIPGLVLFNGLRLVSARVVNLEQKKGGKNALEISAVIPSQYPWGDWSKEVSASEVWRAQAELRYRSDLDPLAGLVEGYYLGRGYDEAAVGTLVIGVFTRVQENPFSNDHATILRHAPLQVFVGSKLLGKRKNEITLVGRLDYIRMELSRVNVLSLRTISLGSFPQFLRKYEAVGGPINGLINFIKVAVSDPSTRKDLYRVLMSADRKGLYDIIKQLLGRLISAGEEKKIKRIFSVPEYVLRAFDSLLDMRLGG